MLEIGIFGATGRVGKLLIDEILKHKETSLTSVYVRNELDYNVPSSVLVTEDMTTFVEASKIVIDFSSKDATRKLLEHAANHPTHLVIGTTGLDKEHFELMEKCAKKMPILYSANMSEGIAILNEIVKMVSKKLRDYDIEITDLHHRLKKDAPSGTALSLANSAAQARGLTDKVYKIGRDSKDCLRKEDEIGILSLRGGDVIGRHTIGFYGEGEYLEFTHNATTRATFAKGALQAALWLKDKKKGLYNMQDVFAF